MTLLHADCNKPTSRIREARVSTMAFPGRLVGAFMLLCRTVVVARTRRSFRRGDGSALARDVANISRMPLTLGDKWDF